MILLVHRIERQFQRNLQQHVFANELRVKVQRMKECFPGNSLPLPTAEVIAAWNDLPNDTVDILPMSMKTGLVFLRAPPPTPTGLAFDTDDATSDGSSLDDSPIDNWLLVDDIDSPTPDAVAPQARERSTTGDSDSMSRCSYSLDQRSNEEDSFHSIDSGSPSSDQENLSSSSEVSPTPVGFYNMVNQWLLDYRARGMGPFAESLVAFGVVSTGTVPLTSRIARAVIRKVARISYTEGKSLENTIRSTALAAFKKEWKSNIQNDTWMDVSSTRENTVSLTPYGINIASFMGSLYDAGIFSAKDIHLCLFFLTEGEKGFDRLSAIHALLVQSNDKLCKKRNLPALMQFKDEITCRDGETGEYLWATTPRSNTIMADIVATIERWLVSQALRRDQFRMTPCHRTIRRQRAVGPRLGGTVNDLFGHVRFNGM